MPAAVETVKCPVCARDRGVACVKLAATPGGRIAWVTTTPHAAREQRARG